MENYYVSAPLGAEGNPCEPGRRVYRLSAGSVEVLTVRAVGDYLDGVQAAWCSDPLGEVRLYKARELEDVRPHVLEDLLGECGAFMNPAKARALVSDAYALGARDAELRLKEGR